VPYDWDALDQLVYALTVAIIGSNAMSVTVTISVTAVSLSPSLLLLLLLRLIHYDCHFLQPHVSFLLSTQHHSDSHVCVYITLQS